MSRGAFAAVAELLDEAARPGSDQVFPAAGLLVARAETVLFEHAAGVAGPPGRETDCDRHTAFDLASLTKPLVTAALTLDLVARGRLHFETTVAELLPGFAAADGADPRRRAVTVRHLLHHDSGLPAYQRYFEGFPSEVPSTAEESDSRRARMLELATSEPLERDPGAGSVYSDIGFLVLGAMLEELEGERIDALASRRILEPLGVEDACYLPLVGEDDDAAGRLDPARIAATGVCEWRGRAVHAEVQDENAWAMGGVASHAGLFATVEAVHRLVLEWVRAAAGRGLLLDRRLVTHAWARASGSARGARRRTPASGSAVGAHRITPASGSAVGSWALGWDTPSPGTSSAGTRVGAGAVGHLGYTGTSIWIDRNRGVHVVLLTNRIACGRSSDAIRALRPRLHDAVFAAVDAGRSGR